MKNGNKSSKVGYLPSQQLLWFFAVTPRPEILDDLPSHQLLRVLANIYLLDPGFLMAYPAATAMVFSHHLPPRPGFLMICPRTNQLLWFLASIYLLDRDFWWFTLAPTAVVLSERFPRPGIRTLDLPALSPKVLSLRVRPPRWFYDGVMLTIYI